MERWRGGEGGIRWLMEITVNSTSKTSNCFLWKHCFIYKISSLSLQTQHIKGFCIYSTHHMYKNIYVWHFSCMSRNHVTRVANYQVWFEFNLPNVSKENSPLQCMRIEIRIFSKKSNPSCLVAIPPSPALQREEGGLSTGSIHIHSWANTKPPFGQKTNPILLSTTSHFLQNELFGGNWFEAQTWF